MKFSHSATIAAPIEQVWDFVMDIPRVATCAPGVDSLEPLDGDRYRGALRVQVGPIKLLLQGEVTVIERDASSRRASLRLDAADKGVGGAIKATVSIALAPAGGATPATEMTIETDAQVMGRIGEFGQPVIRRKADQMVGEFASRLERAINEALG